MDLLSYSAICDILKLAIENKIDLSTIQDDKWVNYHLNEYLREIQTALINKGYSFRIVKYRVSFYDINKIKRVLLFIGIEGGEKCINCNEYYLVKHVYSGIDLLGIKSEYVTDIIQENKESNLIKESSNPYWEKKLKFMEAAITNNIGQDMGDLTRSNSMYMNTVGQNLAGPGGTYDLTAENYPALGLNVEPGMDTYYKTDVGQDMGGTHDSEKFDEIYHDTYSASEDTSSNLVPLISYNETDKEVVISTNSIFGLELEPEKIAQLCAPNTIFMGINEIIEVSKENYLKAYGFLFNDNDVENKDVEWNATSGSDYFMLHKAENNMLLSLYFDKGEGDIVADVFPKTNAPLVICNPLEGLIKPMRYPDPEIQYVVYLDVLKLDDPEANGILLLKEAIVSDDQYLFMEASIAQRIDDAIGAITGLPKKIYEMIKGFSGRLKGLIKKVKKAKHDDEVEDILNDEYFPLLESILKFLMSGAGGWLVGGMVNPLLGLVVFVAGIIIGSIHDTDKKLKATQLLRDEIDIINEKIDDAKSEGDKKAKYELIRLKKELLTRVEKI